MKKHLYLHTSNLEYCNQLREDSLFECVFEYPKIEIEKSHRNEYGRIKTRDNYYHIILGSMPQKNCPWCNSVCEIRKIYQSELSQQSQYCMQCTNCSAHGPILNICFSSEESKESMEYFKEFITHRFQHRTQWDSNFVNPYEN